MYITLKFKKLKLLDKIQVNLYNIQYVSMEMKTHLKEDSLKLTANNLLNCGIPIKNIKSSEFPV